MIDTHAHLGDDAAEVLERAPSAGVARVVDGRDDDRRRARRRSRSPRSTKASMRVSASIRTRPASRRPTARRAARAARSIRAPSPSARPGSTTSGTTRRTTPSSGSSRRSSRSPRDARQARRHPHPRGRRGHARAPARARRPGRSSTASRRQPLLEPALERGWYVSFAGNVTYKNAYDLRAAARRVPADRLLAETDSPYLAPQPVRGTPQRARLRRATRSRRSPRRAAWTPTRLERQIDANADAVFCL